MADPAGKTESGLTVVCLKAGTLYGPEYVNRLYSMVKRNLTRPFRFQCFTDDRSGLGEGIECRPIRDNLEGWWGKISLFVPGVFSTNEQVLFFDLDTVIVRSLDNIAAYNGRFVILRDFYFPQHYGSGVMSWRTSDGSWTRTNGTEGIWYSWNDAGRPRPERGDQEIIEKALHDNGIIPDIWQDKFPREFVSYKVDCFFRAPLSDARVVCFHGSPKPHECKRQFITDNWK